MVEETNYCGVPHRQLRHARLVPLKEACRRFGNISRATAYRGARDGRFPPIRAAMGRAAVREDELEKFIMNAPVAGRKLG
jgi:predicted site-specific integrase-resolvase